MPPVIDADIVGLTLGPVATTIDARWLMAYAAGLGEGDARYYDTGGPAGPAAHPLFPVCYEWPLAVALREKAIDAALAPFGVHASHHLLVHRAPHAGDSLRTTARVTSVERRRSGTLVVVRYATTDHAGVLVSTTDYGSLYRGVAVRGDAAGGSTAARAPGGETDGVRWQEPLTVAAHAAHVYTECARIWNPIHTDVAAARAAGLPGPILHGTATLALAVSRVVVRDLGGDPGRVRAVSARFTGMVTMPSTLTVRGRGAAGHRLAFDVVDEAGAVVLSGGEIAR
jgi:acyl dehydratase